MYFAIHICWSVCFRLGIKKKRAKKKQKNVVYCRTPSTRGEIHLIQARLHLPLEHDWMLLHLHSLTHSLLFLDHIYVCAFFSSRFNANCTAAECIVWNCFGFCFSSPSLLLVLLYQAAARLLIIIIDHCYVALHCQSVSLALSVSHTPSLPLVNICTNESNKRRRNTTIHWKTLQQINQSFCLFICTIIVICIEFASPNEYDTMLFIVYFSVRFGIPLHTFFFHGTRRRHRRRIYFHLIKYNFDIDDRIIIKSIRFSTMY